MSNNRSRLRRLRRPAVGLAGAGLLAAPAIAAAAISVPNGYYSTVEARGVPTAEDVEFFVTGHDRVHAPSLGCLPSAKVAPLVADSGAENIAVLPIPRNLVLKNGTFSYHGAAYLTADYGGAKKVTDTTLNLRGTYTAHGKSYHYTGTEDQPVTATVRFTGTASSPACTGLPKKSNFILYTAVDS